MRTQLPAALLATALICSVFAVPAHAQVPRTFVSAAGSDSNNCANVATPCRHFAAAYAATAPSGEIFVLDPANYGSLTITHAVSIEGHGWASIAPPNSGNAVTINAGPSDSISIHGVAINGTGATGNTNGIVFNSGASLTIEDCIIRDMTNDGLQFFPNETTLGTLAVSNSYFINNDFGIDIQPFSSGAIKAAIDRTGMHGNRSVGLYVGGLAGTGALTVAVTDSVAANNVGSQGFIVQSTTSQSVSNLSLTHVLAEGNAVGVEATGTNATLWLAQSTVTGNATGFNASSSGVINTFQDNYFIKNGPNTGTLTNVGKM